MIHYDLFAGIGGFSLAVDEVFKDEPIKHIFCEWEQFPTAVLKRHWPDGEFWGDIADLVAHTERERLQRHEQRQASGETSGASRPTTQLPEITLVTGGFPCQPFSAAGRRRGTSDDRYKWPEMFAVIRNVRPTWVVAENVRGLVTWNEGMVLEQVCTDLESEGYEVQPLIVPAVAVNAPHRRDRVWIIANRTSDRRTGRRSPIAPQEGHAEGHEQAGQLEGRSERPRGNVTDTRPQRRQPRSSEGLRPESTEPVRANHQHPDWQRDWQEVAFATCNDAVDDGLPRIVDGVPYSRAKWRKESLKAYGNAIVPQVAIQIMKAIKEAA